MSGYHQLGEIVAEVALELQEVTGETPPRERKVWAAAGHLMRAAELLLELEVSPELAAEVVALQALCNNCGHDRGDHMAEAPHTCEACIEDPPQAPDGSRWPCTEFEPMRADFDTLPDLMSETEPAPPPEAS